MEEMNIVVVKHLEESFGRHYTFKVPDGYKCAKGDLVMVNTKLGNKVAECITDSHVVPVEIAEITANGNKITGNVVGRILVEPFMANGESGKVEIRKWSSVNSNIRY